MYNNQTSSQNGGYNSYRNTNTGANRASNNTGNYNTSKIPNTRYNTSSYNTGNLSNTRYNTGTYNTGAYNTGKVPKSNYNTSNLPNTNYNTGKVPTYNTSKIPNTSVANNTGYSASDYDDYGTYDDTPEVTFGGWLLMFFLLSIPGVNLIYAIVQAFNNENMTKRTFARAFLFWCLILLAVTLVSCVFLNEIFNLEYAYDEVYKILRYSAKKLLGM